MKRIGLLDELEEANTRHEEQFGRTVSTLVKGVETEFAFEWNTVIEQLAVNRSLADINRPCLDSLRVYLSSLSYSGWDACCFGPALGLAPLEDYPLALVAYLSCRLMDDGIDGHRRLRRWQNSKRLQSPFGHLAEHMNAREAGGVSVLLGAAILTQTIRRLRDKGRQDAADTIARLFVSIVPGILGESLAKAPVTQEIYHEIVRHKSVEYNNMLYEVFFAGADPKVRLLLLRLLGEMVEASQWLSDLWDEKNDRARGQISVFSIPGSRRQAVVNRIALTLSDVWRQAQGLPAPVRNALASRMAETAKALQREMTS